MENQFKGTPGPWEFEMPKHGKYKAKISGGGWIHFARIVVRLKDSSDTSAYYDEGVRNLKLICAAPELLEAAQNALDHLPSYLEGMPTETANALNHLQAIINKALGK